MCICIRTDSQMIIERVHRTSEYMRHSLEWSQVCGTPQNLCVVPPGPKKSSAISAGRAGFVKERSSCKLLAFIGVENNHTTCVGEDRPAFIRFLPARWVAQFDL